MKHGQWGYATRRRLTVSAPVGGMDVSSPPHRIRDDRASELSNLHYRDGALRTRPSLCERTRGAAADREWCVPLGDDTVLLSLTDGVLTTALLHRDGTLTTSMQQLTDVDNAFAVPSGGAAEGVAVLYVQSINVRMAGVYILYDDAALARQQPYIPTVLTAARGTVEMRREDSGARLESFNRLTESCFCEYTPDGEGIYAWLPADVCVPDDAEFVVTYTDSLHRTFIHRIYGTGGAGVCSEEEIGEDGLRLTLAPGEGAFWFRAAAGGLVALPAGDRPCSIVAQAVCADGSRADDILSLGFGTWFGGSSEGTRLFAAGHPTSGHQLYWSALNDPTYFPVNNCAYVGDASDAITAFGKQGELLAVFKSRELYAMTYYSGESVTVEDVTSGAVTDTEAASAIFPLTLLHGGVGCDCPRTVALCGGRLTWLTSDGHVYALYSGGTYAARRVRALSAPIEAELAQYTAAQLREATAVAATDSYRLAVEEAVYVLDTQSTAFASGANYTTDRTAGDAMVWYAWYCPFPSAQRYTLTTVRGGCVLLVSTASIRYVLTWDGDSGADTLGGTEYPIAICVCSKWFDLGAAGARKQLQTLRLWVAGDNALEVTLCGCDAARTVLTLSPTLPSDPQVIPLYGTRTRLCGIRLHGSGRLQWECADVTYRRMGEMRDE